MKEMKSNTLVLIFFYWILEKTKIFTFNFYTDTDSTEYEGYWIWNRSQCKTL